MDSLEKELFKKQELLLKEQLRRRIEGAQRHQQAATFLKLQLEVERHQHEPLLKKETTLAVPDTCTFIDTLIDPILRSRLKAQGGFGLENSELLLKEPTVDNGDTNREYQSQTPTLNGTEDDGWNTRRVEKSIVVQSNSVYDFDRIKGIFDTSITSSNVPD